jgi:EAL domain-containing protein (putative c-di-GMP-specific phosphodiesterase class I)
VIAEGIENEASAELLLRMGCEEGQGDFFGRPTPAHTFQDQFLAGQRPTDNSIAGRAA